MTPKPTAMVLVVTWIGAATLSFMVLIVPVGFVVAVFFISHREHGWGRDKATFPLLVVTQVNGKPIAHVVMYHDLPSFLPSHNWTPSYSPTVTPAGRLFLPGAGGTLLYRDGLDAAGSVTPTRIASMKNCSPTGKLIDKALKNALRNASGAVRGSFTSSANLGSPLR